MNQGLNNTQVPRRNNLQINSRIVKYGLIYFTIIFLISFIVLSVGAYQLLKYPNIYEGVYVENVHVGGQNKQEALAKIKEQYGPVLEEKQLFLTSKDSNNLVSYKEINAEYRIEEAIENAYNIGRQGNIFEKLLQISSSKQNNIIIPLEIHVDRDRVEQLAKDLASEVDIPVQQYQYNIEGNQLNIKNGIRGEMINIAETVDRIMEAVRIGSTDVIEITPEVVLPDLLDVDTLYSKVCGEPKDADYEVKNYRLHIIPHVNGIKFDREEAKKIIEQNNFEGAEFTIPITITEPKVLAKDLENKFFKDRLSRYITTFNPNDIERTTNVLLSSKAINGSVLGPNDVFSYNEVVGERTAETGYKDAKIYVGGEIVDGIGGGICQVSSTLYNAVLFSNLEIVSRMNHSMTVSYVPIGQDATVAYGLIDFKFRNNRKDPIKIISRRNGNQLIFEIWGTRSPDDKQIEIENVIDQTIPFSTKYIDDPELEEGKTIVKQRGGNGYQVSTYKIIKDNNKIISKSLISKSNYKPIEQVIHRGTKKVEKPKTPVYSDQNEKSEPKQEEKPTQGQENNIPDNTAENMQDNPSTQAEQNIKQPQSEENIQDETVLQEENIDSLE